MFWGKCNKRYLLLSLPQGKPLSQKNKASHRMLCNRGTISPHQKALNMLKWPFHGISSTFGQFYSHRAVVGSQGFRPDEGMGQTGTQPLGNHEVIQTPSDIPSPGPRHEAPPGIMAPILFEFSKCIHKTSLKHGLETAPFLRREPMVALVGFGVGQVQFGMGHIKITTINNRFLSLQFLEKLEEIPIPHLSVFQSAQVPF